jgi:hypothetical protein
MGKSKINRINAKIKKTEKSNWFVQNKSVAWIQNEIIEEISMVNKVGYQYSNSCLI